MKILLSFFLVLSAAFGILAQRPKQTKASAAGKKTAEQKALPTPSPTPVLDEKTEFEKAAALELAADRIAAMKKFLVDFPEAEKKADAKEIIAGSHVLIAEEALNSNDTSGAVSNFKLAFEEGPEKFTDIFFNESIVRIPSTLFFRGIRPAAIETASLIESKANGNAPQLLELANFYLSIEDGGEAARIAKAAIAADPQSAVAYSTLALANRMNFDLEASAASYQKALELDPSSVAAKRGLAEMKRALGKPEESVEIYRVLVTADFKDLSARTGLVLSLFDTGKKAEAETEMAKALAEVPGNVVLISGAAYWYATRGDGEKAVDLGKKAVEMEPRYIWSHIALARGLMAKNKPVDAEQVLIRARNYGNFPTLEYEIASARLMAGFYREAAEDLKNSFTVSDGSIHARLGGRVERTDQGFIDLIGLERKASIFEASAAENVEQASRLKSLLIFMQKSGAPSPVEAEISSAADEFVAGTDPMRIHRELFAAEVLLQKRIALPKVLELATSAIDHVDKALEGPNAGAAVMASELYESRSLAFARRDFLLIPDVPKQTLSSIVRGRIEDTAGWALYQQDRYPEAVVRLRRAISVLPDKSAWWRGSMWRLGAALAADGKDAEALDSYIRSYKTDKPDYAKFIIVESLYKKLNGGTEGLEEKIGPERMVSMASIQGALIPASATVPSPEPSASPVVSDPAESSAALPVSDPSREEKKIEKTADPVATTSGPVIPLQTLVTDKPVEDKKKDDPGSTESAAKADLTVSSLPDPKLKEDQAKTSESTETSAASSKSAEQKAETTPPVNTDVESKTKPTDDNVTKPVETPPAVIIPAAVEPQTKTDDIAPETRPKTADPDKSATDPTNSETGSDGKKIPLEGKASSTEKVGAPATDTSIPETDDTARKDEAVPKKPPGDASMLPENATGSKKSGDSKPTVVITDNIQPSRDLTKRPRTTSNKPPPQKATSSANSTASLFEPIIISIPSKKTVESESAKSTVTDEAETIKAEPAAGASRKRIYVPAQSVPPCKITASQESVSVIADGGRVGILIGMEGGDIQDLRSTSSSPRDIEITSEPEIAGMSDRRLYLIKSTSGSRGVYQASFETVCGRKEILVTVR
ncbi:MAG: hypothetical protein ABI539_07530 [Acidobacteriota bacterium]